MRQRKHIATHHKCSNYFFSLFGAGGVLIPCVVGGVINTDTRMSALCPECASAFRRRITHFMRGDGVGKHRYANVGGVT